MGLASFQWTTQIVKNKSTTALEALSIV